MDAMKIAHRVPVNLVISGFLGAGKTTAIRHVAGARNEPGERWAVVVNEFGKVGY
jgi:G3E family GTPase